MKERGWLVALTGVLSKLYYRLGTLVLILGRRCESGVVMAFWYGL